LLSFKTARRVFAFASGLAAEAAVLELLDQGAHVVASNDLYGGPWRLFHRVRQRTAGFTVTEVEAGDAAAGGCDHSLDQNGLGRNTRQSVTWYRRPRRYR
jgi:cystathionine beta-lyase/cystathionine gamma-synthase